MDTGQSVSSSPDATDRRPRLRPRPVNPDAHWETVAIAVAIPLGAALYFTAPRLFVVVLFFATLALTIFFYFVAIARAVYLQARRNRRND